MFPPPPEEADEYPLQYCMRFLPHDQNTGGFFVAVFEKVSELPSATEMKNILPELPVEPPKDSNSPKSQICKHYYKTGECRFGDKCKFLHVIEGDAIPDNAEIPVGDSLSDEEKKDKPEVEKERLKPINPDLIPDLKSFYGIDDSFNFSLLYCRSNQIKVYFYL